MVVLNGKIWSLGGIEDDTDRSSHESRATSSAFAYDPAADSWSSAADLPKALWGQAGAAADGSIYTFGGAESDLYGPGDFVDTIYRFQPGSGWSTVSATCPEPIYAARATHGPDGLIYVIGGGTGAENIDDTDRIWRFDPSSETVESANWATLPRPLRWVSCCTATVDGTAYLYATGGHDTGPNQIYPTTTRYPLSGSNAGTAESMADAPVAFRQALSNCVIDGTLYIACGHMGQSDFQTEADAKENTYAYDLAADSWNSDLPNLPRGHGRYAGPHGVVDGKVVVAGGHIKLYSSDDEHDVKDFVDVLTPGGQ